MVTENKDRSDWVTKKCSSFDEMRAFRVQQWQEEPFMKRLDAAWEIVEDAWKLKKKDPDELRLQRSVTTVVRRGR